LISDWTYYARKSKRRAVKGGLGGGRGSEKNFILLFCM